MSNIAARLAELGLELPPVAKPAAAYIPAVVSGSHVFTSGQLPFIGGELPAAGKLGGAISVEDGATYARAAALNALAAIDSVIGSLDRVTKIVKVTCFVASEPDFTSQSLVANGASVLLGELFGPEIGTHARSAVGMAVLPFDSPVEVELIVEFA